MADMDHDEWLEQADVYALGALDADELAQFETHVPDCSLCRERLKEFGEAITLIPKSFALRIPPSEVKSRIFYARKRLKGALEDKRRR